MLSLIWSALFCLAITASPLFAQTGVVIKPINLIANPSTDLPPMRTLFPPETFRLVEPKEQGSFFHVRTDKGEIGWVLKEHVSLYDRSTWNHWIDADKDCQDGRHEVLIQESTLPVTFNPNVCRGSGANRHCDCRVESGRWEDPYSGEVFTDPGQLQIDHVVAIGNAHVAGGWAWDEKRREAYANDLEHPEHLIAVKGSVNQSKGDRAPDQWKPPRQEFWCEYATIWLQIKQRWGLILTASEATAVAEMKKTCP